MRTLTDHKTNGLNESLEIEVADEPGQGGANHRYEISGFDESKNPSVMDRYGGNQYCNGMGRVFIIFQNGPIKDVGVNGISQEALLAIVIDRLRSFQAGPYACEDNDFALSHCEDALKWMQSRTQARLVRGVEGTSQK